MLISAKTAHFCCDEYTYEYGHAVQNVKYFILKSKVLNNLYILDITKKYVQQQKFKTENAIKSPILLGLNSSENS